MRPSLSEGGTAQWPSAPSSSLGAGFQDLLNPTVQLEEITWDVWGVLGISFFIDGSVLYQSIQVGRLGAGPWPRNSVPITGG